MGRNRFYRLLPLRNQAKRQLQVSITPVHPCRSDRVPYVLTQCCCELNRISSSGAVIIVLTGWKFFERDRCHMKYAMRVQGSKMRDEGHTIVGVLYKDGLMYFLYIFGM